MRSITSCILRMAPLAIATSGLLPAAVYQPASDEPTGAEVEIVELMNRYRADPTGEAARILQADDLPGWFWRDVDRGMFEREVTALGSAPPLVIDLDALRAARRHSYYMIHNGLGHDETAGREGFTGSKFSERMRAAGFGGRPTGENCFAQVDHAWTSHAGFIVDRGPGGSGGMQPGRGHRMNMIADKSNVVGPGAVARSGGGLSVTHNFGRVDGRFAGGAIYRDENGNGRFDAGEGIGGVEVRTVDGRASVRTWASGGYTLPVPGSGATSVVVEYQGVHQTCAVPAGGDNVAFSWAVPAAAELATADRLIAAVAAIPDDERNQRRRREAAVELALASEQLSLDAERAERIAVLTAGIAEELASARRTTLDAIASGDEDRIAAALADQRAWRGTLAADWFGEAELLARASLGVAGVAAALAQGREIPGERLEQLESALAAAYRQARFPTIRAAFADLQAQAAALR